ncbi:unnamed protein product [Didymodactylos carnosus]|uniref:Uncharacterized protein n=1 Tax=Didymodactylos carnosus TaxID=1234261 RepID=A0A8S2IA05_9BILA|nr:unnamed protein product [Didymodactylos carnosus]CAF3719555.1 unnamed protein product [Didymodactylos carnosus]
MVLSKLKNQAILKWRRGYYIAFNNSLKTILALLEMGDILSQSLRDDTTRMMTTTDIKTDYSTGTFCDSHGLFKQKSVLEIILYYDDIGLTNALRSKRKSVGMFYYTLQNIPRYLRLQDKCVQLLACAETKFIKRCGVSKLLNNFMESVNQLQTNGVEVELEDGKTTFYGSLLAIVRDLLGLASLHGFKCGFCHANKPYFLCYCTKKQSNTLSSTEECKHREMKHYLAQFSKLKDGGLKKYWLMFQMPVHNI